MLKFETYGGERIPVTLTFGTAQFGSAPAAAYVDFDHVGRRSKAPAHYRVELLTTPQPFGGHRWWFICPAAGHRVTKLFLPHGADRFASRAAYRLGYACQRTGGVDRLDRRAAKIYRSLSGPTCWRDGIPPKPRWMRWPTYSRRALSLRSAIARYEAAWCASVMRRFSGPPAPDLV